MEPLLVPLHPHPVRWSADLLAILHPEDHSSVWALGAGGVAGSNVVHFDPFGMEVEAALVRHSWGSLGQALAAQRSEDEEDAEGPSCLGHVELMEGCWLLHSPFCLGWDRWAAFMEQQQCWLS